jgi:hypothetical protein
MAFADWDFYNNAAGTQALDLTNPLVGNGSLRYQSASTTIAQHTMTAHLKAQSFTLGVAKGRIRTLVQIEAGGVAIQNNRGNHAGMIAMRSLSVGSAHDAVGGALYFAGIVKRAADNDWELFLAKHTTGVPNTMPTASGGNTTIFGSPIPIALVDQSIIPIQFEWVLDLTQLGGIRLTLSRGNIGDTTFVNLATAIDVVDASALTTANAEGLWAEWSRVTGTGGLAGYRYDETSVFELL